MMTPFTTIKEREEYLGRTMRALHRALRFPTHKSGEKARKHIDEVVLPNSYRNFHVQGFDYLCLRRKDNYTLKVYTFDGDVTQAPEVVNPHDHRYAFRTTVLNGALLDYRYTLDPRGKVFNAFDYRTPLNGGDGFTFRGEERLLRHGVNPLRTDSDLLTTATELHHHPGGAGRDGAAPRAVRGLHPGGPTDLLLGPGRGT